MCRRSTSFPPSWPPQNLADPGLHVERQLAALLAAWLGRSPTAPPNGLRRRRGAQPLSPEDSVRLHSLGYAGG